MILRPYQTAAVEEVLSHIDERPILVSPTGSGKSVMLAEIVRRLGVRTLALAHRRELVGQLADHLRSAGLEPGIIQAGCIEQRSRAVQVASVQTLARRRLPEAALVLLDECHHARASTFASILDSYPEAYRLGTTATPFRLDGRGLGSMFGRIVVAAYPDDLCADGTLVAPIVYVPENPNLSRVRITAGEYNLKQAGAVMDQPKLTANIIDTWSRLAHGRRSVVFATNVQHSHHIVERFVSAGVAAEHLDASTPAIPRAQILKRLRTGETTVVSQCQILTEGYDLPSLEVAVVARPTASRCLHLQMIGRLMRACEGKAGALVLDHAGNHLRHGEVTQRIDYTLEGAERSSSDAPWEPPVKRCPECYMLVPAATLTCPGCNHDFSTGPAVPRESDGALVPLAPRVEAPFPDKARYWAVLEEQRLAHGFKPGWSAYRFQARYGYFPTIYEGRLIDPLASPVAARQAEYRRLLRLARERGYREKWADVQFKIRFHSWPNRLDRMGAA